MTTEKDTKEISKSLKSIAASLESIAMRDSEIEEIKTSLDNITTLLSHMLCIQIDNWCSDCETIDSFPQAVRDHTSQFELMQSIIKSGAYTGKLPEDSIAYSLRDTNKLKSLLKSLSDALD